MSDIMSACNSHQSTLWTQSISMRFCWVVIFFGLTLSAKIMPTGGVDEGCQFINKKILSSAITL